MDQPKTRAEKGKGKGAKTKQEFNQRTVRLKEAALALGSASKKGGALLKK